MVDIIKICTYPDPILNQKAELIKNIDGDLQCLIDKMTETMYSAPGIGLAANQIGQLKQLIVYDINHEKERNPSVLINPEIVMAEGEILYEEACLSVIDYSAEVSRSSKIKPPA